MKLTVNNKEVETSCTDLQQLAEELSLPVQGVAVAVNNRMIPCTEWPTQALHENDRLVIIKAACGG